MALALCRLVAPSRGLAAPARGISEFVGRLNRPVDGNSDRFRENEAGMRELVTELNATLESVAAGGGEKAVQRHLSKGGMLVRDRIKTLLDPSSPFLELSPLAAHKVGALAGRAGGEGRALTGGRRCTTQTLPRRAS